MPTLTEGNPASISLRLAHNDYTILIGTGLIERSAEFISATCLGSGKVAILTDSNVGPIYAERVVSSFRSVGAEPIVVTIPAGEASKSMERLTSICRELIRAGLDRKSLLVALGGGVVGDLAGFAASIFQRGIPLVQIPTTIVSQVDSSVGGKTGVNTPEGKNLLGSFHQPKLVIADTGTLSSLPEREFNEGFAEIIKHAAIRDASLLDLVERQYAIRNNLVQLVARNVLIKAAIIEQDERETTGIRALLNFGHTLGHAVEAAGGYGRFLHGEAISLGLVAATRLSIQKCGLDTAIGDRITEALHTYGLPTALPNDVSDRAILAAMRCDKKFESGQLRFVLLRSLGDAFVSAEVSEADVENTLTHLRS